MPSIWVLLLVVSIFTIVMSNLPSAPFDPVYQYQVRREIDAPIERVWSMLTDIKSYTEW